MSDLIARLRAAIDETERIAVGALDHPGEYNPATKVYDRIGDDDGVWQADRCYIESVNVDRRNGGIRIYDEGGHDEQQAQHIAHHDPAAVLRRCKADRTLLQHAATHCAKYDERVETGDQTSIEHGAAMYEVIYQLGQAYGIEPTA